MLPFSCTYDDYNNRSTMTVNHIWDGDQIALETDSFGNITNKYVRGITLLYAENTAGTRQYYLFNGHGDVVQLTGTNGSVTRNYDYDAFGNEKNPDVNDTNVFRYCGEYFDLSSGTYYLRARYYAPQVGRFISEDSYWGKSSDPLSLNLYTYCSNNPINFVDPTGHMRYEYDKNGKVIRDLDAEEFGKNSDTYKILQDLSDRYTNAKNNGGDYKNYAYIANKVRKCEREKTPIDYAQNRVMVQLHSNAEDGVYQQIGCEGVLPAYGWFVWLTFHDWDYKWDDNWRVPYKKFLGYNMENPKDGDLLKNTTKWMYFDGMLMAADQFGNMNLGYVGKRMGFDGYLLLNFDTNDGDDEFWVKYGIDMAKQGR